MALFRLHETISKKNLSRDNFGDFISRQSRLYSLITYAIECFLIIITVPITLTATLLFAIIVSMESEGGAFYSQTRSGINGSKFKIYKLRSMYINAEKNGPQWAQVNDTRVTKVGHFIRKTRIDELPQLWNVLKGDMSLVGPRPERPEFISEFKKELPDFDKRLLVKPGLTGWAQINGGYELTPAEKLELDMHYIKKQSILFDLYIILITLKVVITGQGAR